MAGNPATLAHKELALRAARPFHGPATRGRGMATRGFAQTEFEARLRRAQAEMDRAGLAALLLTTEPEVRYFTGYLTRFWESPTRPWFLILPAHGKPVAVIPAIGAELMGQTWIEDIRCWSAPDLEDDGIGLLADTLRELTQKGARIGLPDGHETQDHAGVVPPPEVVVQNTEQQHEPPGQLPLRGVGHRLTFPAERRWRTDGCGSPRRARRWRRSATSRPARSCRSP